MARTDAFRYRITFAKTLHMRYTSHLDVQRTWERLIRRAQLPLLFTQGFHPRARFNLAAALPLGFIGEAELAELYLTENVECDALAERLREAAPPGIRIDAVTVVDPRAPAVQTAIDESLYSVRLDEAVDVHALGDAVQSLLGADEVMRERRGKTYDLRPLVRALDLDVEARRMSMRLQTRDGATGRPDEVLAALGLDPLMQLVCREALVLAEETHS